MVEYKLTIPFLLVVSVLIVCGVLLGIMAFTNAPACPACPVVAECAPWPGSEPCPDAPKCGAGVEGQVPVFEVCCGERGAKTCAKFGNEWDAWSWQKRNC